MDPRTTSPSWSPGKRALFRFAFCYLVVYTLPFPLNAIPWAGEILSKPYEDLWNGIVPWAGKHLLGLGITIRPAGSGDTTYNYVQIFCFLILAAAVTVVWTALDRKRTEHTRLYEGLRTYIRFALAAAMLLYGADKVIPSQFAKPFPSQLIEPFGESSPMGLLWTFMGASSGYTIFAGASEMLGGFLGLQHFYRRRRDDRRTAAHHPQDHASGSAGELRSSQRYRGAQFLLRHSRQAVFVAPARHGGLPDHSRCAAVDRYARARPQSGADRDPAALPAPLAASRELGAPHPPRPRLHSVYAEFFPSDRPAAKVAAVWCLECR